MQDLTTLFFKQVMVNKLAGKTKHFFKMLKLCGDKAPLPPPKKKVGDRLSTLWWWGCAIIHHLIKKLILQDAQFLLSKSAKEGSPSTFKGESHWHPGFQKPSASRVLTVDAKH